MNPLPINLKDDRYTIILCFNMPYLLAGTGYNQTIGLDTGDKKQIKTVYGAQQRQPVRHLYHISSIDLTLYATNKVYYLVHQGSVEEMISIHGPEKIVGIGMNQEEHGIGYVLSNGSIFEQELTRNEFVEVYKGVKHNEFVGSAQNRTRSRTLFYGKGVVPLIVDK